MNNGIVFGFVAAIVLMGNLSVSNAAEQTVLDASEIKNVRYISRMLLKGRAIEKARIESELLLQRKQLNDMYAALHELNVYVVKEMSDVIITRESGGSSSFGELIVEEQVVSSGKVKNVQAVPGLSVSNSKVYRKRAITTAISKLKQTGRKVMLGMLSKSMMSRLDSRSYARSKRLVSTNLLVTKELEQMLSNDKVDLKKVKNLQETLSLMKQAPAYNDMHPTLESRTAHRK